MGSTPTTVALKSAVMVVLGGRPHGEYYRGRMLKDASDLGR